MGDQVRLARGKPRPPGRGARKPGARHLVSERAPPAAFQAFGELQQREFERSPWPMRIFEHGTFRFLAVNDAAVKLYGYTRDELLAMTAKDTRHPEELDDFLTTLDEPTSYFRHRGPRRHIRKNGEIIVVEAVTQDILFNGRKARLSMNIDVTERNKAEDEVRRQKNLFAAVIDNLPVGIFIRDAKTLHYVMRNRFSEKMFDYPLENLAGKTAYDVFPKEQADLIVATDRQALESGQMVDIPESKIPGRAGDMRIRHVRKVPVFDQDGKPWLLVGIADDITERKRVERELHESEKKYRNLVESSSDLIWSADAAGRITFINQAVRQIYGYEPEEMLGRPIVEFLGKENRKKSYGFFRRMLSEDRSWADYECEVRHKNGQPVILSSNAIVMRDGEGKRIGVTGISKDITDRKRAEQERLTHAIQQRDALVREVHHRIKNSLQGVVGLLRQKIRKYPASAPGIEEAIMQLQSVATVYGLQGRELERNVSLAEILDAICTSAENLTGGNVIRDFDVDNGHGTLVDEAEAVPLAVALNELVFNALKHQPAEDDEKRARVALRETKDAAEICITNRGRLPAGFDFARGRAIGHGLGLVRTLIALPGGAITFTGGDEEVEVVLKLSPPLLAERERAFAR